MPKAKQSAKRKKFDYNRNRKNLKKKFIRKSRPRIENQHIRNGWDNWKSTARNLGNMGLSFDPNHSIPFAKQRLTGVEPKPKPKPKAQAHIVTKPYILKQLEEEASLPEKDTKTLSTDLIEYVQHMIRNHQENYKAMARDEKNYYQDTPKQIKRKIDQYKRCHPQLYQAFVASLAAPEPMAQ